MKNGSNRQGIRRNGIALRVLGALLLLAAAGYGLAPRVEARQTAPPPILDRELFFGDPEITGAQISPDGRFIAFLKPFHDVRNIWVKKTDAPFDTARPLTAETHRPISVYFWSRDGRFVLFTQDQDGDENFNVYAVQPGDAPATGKEVPQARNLTDAKGARAMIYAAPKSAPDVIYVGLNDRDAAWHDLYRLNLGSGERTLLRKNTDRVAAWFFDNRGRLRLAVRVADSGDTEILRVDEDALKTVYTCSVFESCDPVRFHKDDRRVYITTNKGAAVDLTRLVLLDPSTGKEEVVESDLLGRVDFGAPMFSEVTDELIGTTYDDEKARVYWRDKAFQADYDFLRKKLGGEEITFASGTADEKLWLVAGGSDVEPGESYLYDRGTRKLALQYRVREKLPRSQLATMVPVRYKSSDGTEISAYLTLPKGVPAKNLPAMIIPHGGPWARDDWGYDGIAQFLANRGYAVLQPNFRGSTGYGKKFLNAGNNEWGQKMQDDLTWGVQYLVARGIADAKRVGILGGSYGGYATLAGVAFTPDVYAAGVSIVGPSNLITLLGSIPPYWEAGRKIFYTRMGDPGTAEGKAQLERQSPLTAAKSIKTPLLVVQGANDPRVKKAESDQIVVALRDRGFPVEYIVAPDEGHGFARPVNNLALFASAERFLAKHLGGRVQESMSGEVRARLAEITVDVKTVKLVEKVDPAKVGAPKPAADLSAGKATYQARIETGGQTIPLTLTREIREDGGSWVITDVAKTPMGDMQDRTVVAKGSLVVSSRSVQQGPATMNLAFEGGKATGTMSMGGEPKVVAFDLGGDVFADGAASEASLAALPLAEGFTTTFRNVDLMRQKVKMMRMSVVGVEPVTVPAGTFDAFRIEVASAEGEAGTSTVWIAKDARKTIKMTSTLPDMGGATMTAELAN